MNKVTLLNLGFIVVVGTGLLAQLGLFLLDVAAKNMLVLALATIGCWLLYRATAATRHLVWTASLAVLLAMPVLSLIMPQWNVLPEWLITESPANVPVAIKLDPVREISTFAPSIGSVKPFTAADATSEVVKNQARIAAKAEPTMSPITVSVTTILCGWLVGVFACLSPILVGFVRLNRLQKESHTIRQTMQTAAKIERKVLSISQRLNIAPPQLFFAAENSMPMVWRWLDGTRLMLPASAVDWSNERLEIVLLHELVHLRRGDPLTLLMGQIARALNWFNPVVWFAFRQMTIERERCCDDYVLRSGVVAETYASCLLELATRLRANSNFETVALSMATKSKVESRLKLILDKSLNRRRIGLASASTLLALVAILAAILSSLAAGNATNDDEMNDEIKWPFCELEIDDLPIRSIEDAVDQFNQDAKTSPIGSSQPPIDKQEVLDAISQTIAAPDFDKNVTGVLEEVLRTGQLPPNVYLRRFTRFDDGNQMHGVWWVRLIVNTDNSSPHSVTIRNRHLFSRPYTLLERKQIASGHLMLLNRLSVYYQSLPKAARIMEDLGNRTQRFAREFQEAVTAQDREKVLALFDFNGVSAPNQEFAESEIDLLLQSKIKSVKFRHRKLDGHLIHWQGFQKWKTNLPIAGFIEVDFVAPGSDRSKSVSLEVGMTPQGSYQFAGYVSTRRVPMPKAIRPAMGVRSEVFSVVDKLPVATEPAPRQPILMTWTVTNPGKLLSGHLSNEEIWLRDVQAHVGRAKHAAVREVQNVNDPNLDEKFVAEDSDGGEKEPEKPDQIWVNGSIVDRETREPIRNAIIVQAGKFDPDDAEGKIEWGFSETHIPNANGKFTASVKPNDGWTARVLVDGYLPEPIDLNSLPDNETRPKITLELTPGQKVSGRITNHLGLPVAGANVFAIGPAGLNVYAGQAYRHGQLDPHANPQITDKDGRFKELILDTSGRIGISSPRMYAWPYTVQIGENVVDIQLPEPGALVINYDIDGAPEVSEMLLQMLTYSMGDAWTGLQLERSKLELQRGETKISGLPPGPYQIFRNVPVMFVKNGHAIPLQRQFFSLEAGKTHIIDWSVRGIDAGSRIKTTVKWNRQIPIDGMMFTVQSKQPAKDLGNQDWPNNLDGGKVELESGRILTARLAPGEYTMIVQIQKPISDERLRFTGWIGLDYTKKVDFSVPRGGPAEMKLADIVLDDFTN